MKKLVLKLVAKKAWAERNSNSLFDRYAVTFAFVIASIVILSLIGAAFDWAVVYGMIFNSTRQFWAALIGGGLITAIIQVFILGGAGHSAWNIIHKKYKKENLDYKRWRRMLAFTLFFTFAGLSATWYLSGKTNEALTAITHGFIMEQAENVANDEVKLEAMREGELSKQWADYNTKKADKELLHNDKIEAEAAKYDVRIATYEGRKDKYEKKGETGNANYIQTLIDKRTKWKADKLAPMVKAKSEALSSLLEKHESDLAVINSKTQARSTAFSQSVKKEKARLDASIVQMGQRTVGANRIINILSALLTIGLTMFYRDAEQDLREMGFDMANKEVEGNWGFDLRTKNVATKKQKALSVDVDQRFEEPDAPLFTLDDAEKSEEIELSLSDKVSEEEIEPQAIVNFAAKDSHVVTKGTDKVLPVDKALPEVDYNKVSQTGLSMAFHDKSYHLKQMREAWRNFYLKPAKRRATMLSRLDTIKVHMDILTQKGYRVTQGETPGQLECDKEPVMNAHKYRAEVKLNSRDKPTFKIVEDVT